MMIAGVEAGQAGVEPPDPPAGDGKALYRDEKNRNAAVFFEPVPGVLCRVAAWPAERTHDQDHDRDEDGTASGAAFPVDATCR